MTDRPIPFSAPMAAALLAGRKTQTRRALPRPEQYGCPTGDCPHDRQEQCNQAMRENTAADLRYAVGDRLYVREEYYQVGHWEPVENRLTHGGDQKWTFVPADEAIRFDPPETFRKARHRNDPGAIAWHKRLGRFMPRKFSRMTLIVTAVRVELLNDCSPADALAEGVTAHPNGGFHVPGVAHPDVDFPFISRSNAREVYAALWDVINGSGQWLGNPWVIALTFEVQHRNIDQCAD